MEGFDAFEKTDRILEILGRSLGFSQLVEVSLTKPEMEVFWNFRTINRGYLHDMINYIKIYKDNSDIHTNGVSIP